MPQLRALLFSESVTLAQVVRLKEIGAALARDGFEVHFAAFNFDPQVFADVPFRHWRIEGVDSERLLRDLEEGRWIYSQRVLRHYIAEDLKLLQQIQPDVVVGDMRLSLPISARLAGVPLATLINAYWSPYAVRERFPIPDHPIIKLVGLEKAERFFPQALPHVLARFAAPVNQLRRRNGLSTIGDLLQVLTYGDLVLHPDVPELVPTTRLPNHHVFIGPVLWQPRGELPAAWFCNPRQRRIYVTLGSSGRSAILPIVLDALTEIEAQVLLATAQHALPGDLPANVVAAHYVPGQDAARHADLVITNGGSSTGYQALAEGRPVLGIASNLDQYLAMDAIERTGAGLCLRAGTATSEQVTATTRRLLAEPGFSESARAVSSAFGRYTHGEVVVPALRRLVAGAPTARPVTR